MKKILFSFIFIFLFSFFIFSPVSASEKVDIYFFYGDGCPHCAKEEIFLDKLAEEVENIEVHRYEVWFNRENADLIAKIAKSMDLANTNVPITIIGDTPISGYSSDDTTGELIESIVDYYSTNTCFDRVASIMGTGTEVQSCTHNCEGDGECLHDCGCSADNSKNLPAGNINKQDKINLPFLGTVEIKNFSLPILTIIIAALDGFNPCAMWALLFLISLLLGMKDRVKMWIMGSVFVFVSGAVYFLFMAAWLNVLLFIGFLFWVRMAIGGVAIGSGIYHLRDFWKNRDGKCKVTDSEKKKNYFSKLKKIVIEEKFWMSLLGIIVLAVSVNMVELLCSAGLPAVYTQILTMAGLSKLEYYGYLLLYIIIFMLDDMLIFILAMVTFKMTAFSSKYTRWTSLIGGILMLVIGVLLMFKPGLIMF